MEVKIARSESELENICDVLLQLRPMYSRKSLIAQIVKQQQNGYQIAYVESDGQVLCVAGFVLGEKLAWGKYIYIDDLVTDEHHRSKGAGKALIDWIKFFAIENGCAQIHLDSYKKRLDTHRFYLREGFDHASHHFSITEIKRES